MLTRSTGLPVMVAVLLALAAFQFSTPVSAQAQRGATLTVLRGEVAVVRANGSAVQPAPSGTTVDTGDQIRTLTRAGALITFFSGTEIEMGEGTILEVDEITRDGDKVNVSLKQIAGVTLNRVQSLASGSSYQIDAGGAVAVVRGTTFALAGPTPTSQGNVVALACLADCSPVSTFGGCAMQPFMGIGVIVERGKQVTGCQTWSIAANAGYFDAAVEGITTSEQAFTGGNPGQVALGQQISNAKPVESNSHTERDEEREQDQNDCPPGTNLPAPSGILEVLALTGAGGMPAQIGALLSPWFLIALGRSRSSLRLAGRPLRRVRGPVGAVLLALLIALSGLPFGPSDANAAQFNRGDVFVGAGNGRIDRFSPTGTLLETLDTGSGSSEQTGMCFDQDGNLYATSFSTNTMTKFNSQGARIIHPFDGPFNDHPESCVVDRSGNVYVGQADGSQDIVKVSPSGARLATFNPATEDRGTDWIDLAADQCTLFYTSEGLQVKRFDVCANRQLADFARLPTRPAFALRIRQNNEVLVATGPAAYRLSPTGSVVRTYPSSTCSAGATLFALNLDPDGETFWTADFGGARVCRINIETGALVSSFTPRRLGPSIAGLAIFGEITASGGRAATTPATPRRCG